MPLLVPVAVQTTHPCTDGPDAVPAMAIMVPKVAAYAEWAGMEINMTFATLGCE